MKGVHYAYLIRIVSRLNVGTHLTDHRGDRLALLATMRRHPTDAQEIKVHIDGRSFTQASWLSRKAHLYVGPRSTHQLGLAGRRDFHVRCGFDIIIHLIDFLELGDTLDRLLIKRQGMVECV